MNVLIINASPRKNGNIDRMLQAMQDEAERLGHEVSNVRVDQLHVAPCRGCMACNVYRVSLYLGSFKKIDH